MTDSNDYNDTNALCIGTQETGGGNTINGFISNVRIVNGTALYTGNFTPPDRNWKCNQHKTSVLSVNNLCDCVRCHSYGSIHSRKH